MNTDRSTENEIRSIVERIVSGYATQSELESAVSRALRDGELTRVDLLDMVDRDGLTLLPPELLTRLGLIAPSTEARWPQPTAVPTEICAIDASLMSARGQQQDTIIRGVRPETAQVAGLPRAGGRILGARYLLERELGAGGMGVVYLARDLQIQGELFAVKVMNLAIREHPEALNLVREEVRKTRALQHPNIVGVYSANGDGADVYILMEYLQGKTLRELIDDDFSRGMPMDRAWVLIQDICRALAYAHDHNVIHSDLKPSNVFINTSGKAKLLDFGIARAARGRAKRFDPGVLGAVTLAYASCEMLEGGEPDQRDDVYSLGCLLYEVLSGHRPFDRSATVARANRLPVVPIKSLTRGQNKALAAALAYDREKRTGSIESVMAGLKPRMLPRYAVPGIVAALAVSLVIGGIVAFVSDGLQRYRGKVSQAPAAVTEKMREVETLMAKARRAAIDPGDSSLQAGMRRLAESQQKIEKGSDSDVPRLLAEAQTSIEHALQFGDRVAQVGSPRDEIAQAIVFCRQAGSNCSESGFADESARTVLLKAFEIDTTEVTNRAFGEFVTDTSYRTVAELRGSMYQVNYLTNSTSLRPGESWKTYRDSLTKLGVDSAAYPVRGIDFRAASDYCAWRKQRLPAEAEWEFAARGSDRRIFAWGNTPRLVAAGSPAGVKTTGEQPISGYFDARGLGDGLLEWVEGGSPTSRVLRGASWLDIDPVNERLARRREIDPRWAFPDTGFRCARSLKEWP